MRDFPDGDSAILTNKVRLSRTACINSFNEPTTQTETYFSVVNRFATNLISSTHDCIRDSLLSCHRWAMYAPPLTHLFITRRCHFCDTRNKNKKPYQSYSEGFAVRVFLGFPIFLIIHIVTFRVTCYKYTKSFFNSPNLFLYLYPLTIKNSLKCQH